MLKDFTSTLSLRLIIQEPRESPLLTLSNEKDKRLYWRILWPQSSIG